ncbi:UMP kinase [Mycoplasmopsis synoviae]|uniref:Uridylate kinase n=3 Tax=Mycoplasmopsis synoviae TaxID=2109 RepID=PYRH_MYCS5|nr:UMP kinase [Mycoplasmopsis synoviae]Q4A587.1 RecName: Full=Uridylate kinase; Short=UK; AltName: Full=Uridine monophosphate kinase; Short=UMP kinase; Short=UMPK [Mycoplasmopsis synoviae 53]AAZ44084.1 uridylate kinase smbA [Mycoplasmopsis synoviae 53]AKB11392.1 uridylate kinase [Mycoplasmopsis synoviae ATCC 25204]MBD5788460.1 uridylate kinase [Mycoplasmopsis synoviae GX11-T]QGL45324.1 UMP kinase [Mycoplasmopsis synoviae]QXV99471.1 UMP kinase [Mycoplasmopsis synoviae]
MIKYKRILIKLSGEGFANKEKNLAIDFELVAKIASQLKIIIEKGVQVSIVVGGGNFWRGVSAEKNGIPRNRADFIGMLATEMNALALQSGFEKAGLKARVQSSINIDQKVAENYINEKTLKYLNNGEVVIFAGGTGRPYFTTDTAATLFAAEIKAEVILMGKNKVDGVYDSDPKKNENAKHFSKITYDQILEKKLQVMDLTATSMARDNNINLIVFNLLEDNSIIKALEGKITHTEVTR